ncbi:MAG: hypothetical protein ACJ75P_09765 [Gaiellaceae bacterium]
MRQVFAYGGIAASVILIAFGIGAVVIGINGRSEVRDAIAEQNITATPDAPALSNGELKAGQPIKNGSQAKAFANVMEHHALEATGGKRYAEMGRFLTAAGKETNDENQAAKDPKTDQPVENGLRNLWVTETALTTALNTSYFAEQVAVFSIVMGIAMMFTGIGFLVLTLGGALGLVKVPGRKQKFEASAAT